jgi:hypothetical protein
VGNVTYFPWIDFPAYSVVSLLQTNSHDRLIKAMDAFQHFGSRAGGLKHARGVLDQRFHLNRSRTVICKGSIAMAFWIAE